MTDRRRLCPGADFERERQGLLLQARYAVDAGVDLLQIRERDLDAGPLARISEDIVRLAEGSRTHVIVNDRLDVALAAGAAGVHLRSDSAAADTVRAVAPRPFLIGRSIHGAAEAAEVAGAVDYIIAGTVWVTPSKGSEHPVFGLDGLAAAVRAARVPVFAIGGLTPERLPLVAAAGAAGAAAIGLFMAPQGAACRAMPLDGVVNAARAARVDGGV